MVDCGAVEGSFSLMVTERCLKIYIIEPLKSFCECLEKKFAGNPNVEILQMGVFKRRGLCDHKRE